MLWNDGRRRAAPALVLATLLGGCVSFDSRDWTLADSGSGGMFRAAWGGMRSDRPVDSDTIRRVRGVDVALEPLQVEPGSVWPVEEAPRATLANPDAALRGVPAYRPGEPRSPDRLWEREDRPRDLAPRADGMPPPEDVRPAPPPRRRGASSPPPPPLVQPEVGRVEVLPVPPGASAPPARRSDGQVVLTPGGPVTTTGGTDRVQGFVGPGGQSGVIHRDGGVTTVVPSGGMPQTFPTPR
jgi:hypothetical protein